MMKTNKQSIIFIILIYLFVFQELIAKYIGVFQYADELFAFLVIPVLVIKNKSFFSSGILKINKTNFKKNFLIFLIVLIGLLSNLKSGLQKSNAIIYDLIILLKFPLACWCSSLLFDSNFINKYKETINFHVKLISFFMFILTILNYAFKLFPITHRYGLVVNQLFYSHPGKLVMISAFLIILNELTSKRKLSFTTYMLFLVAISTLRSKGIGFCVIAFLLIIFISKNNKKISFSKIGFIGLICILVVYDQISVYYIDNNSSPRYMLVESSLKIANENFPIGAGFATYGSYGSAVFYSPLYQRLGLHNVYGFDRVNYSYICDTFWPMILGQFGYLGLIIYLMYIILIFRDIQKIDINKNKSIYLAKILCLAYLVISSMSESAFVNPVAVTLALIMGIKVNEEVKYEKN